MPTSKRKRKSLSCNDCKNLKRKCNRKQPCSNCLRTARSCLYSAQEFSAIKAGARSSDDYVQSTSQFKHSSHHYTQIPEVTMTTPAPSYHLSDGSPSHMERANQRFTCTTLVKSLLSERIFVKALLAVWFRELDCMYDVVCDTQAETLRYNDGMEEGDYKKYMPLLAVMLALTAQLHGPDLDAVVSACFDPLLSSRELVEPALTLAKDTIDELLDASNSEEGEHTILPEYLQASLLVCAFFKNAGWMDRYRGRLYRDISRLVQASYHVLDSFSFNVQNQHTNSASSNLTEEDFQHTPHSIRILRPDQRSLVRRIFWAYFTCDRLYLMIGGPTSSYAIISKHCNIWCYDGKRGDGRFQHIHELCNEQGDWAMRSQINKKSNGTHRASSFKRSQRQNSQAMIVNRLRSYENTTVGGLSKFARGMVRVGALAGQCSDQISHVRASQPLHPGSVEAAETLREYEESLASYQAECFRVASLLEEQLTALEKQYIIGMGDRNAEESTPTSSAPSISPFSNTEESKRQSHILMLTIYRLRRDVALSLGLLLRSAFPSIRPWLDRKELVTARALLEVVLLVPVDVPPRAMGWIFYLHYIAEPTMGLTKSISNSSGIDKRGATTMLSPEEAKINLHLALKGRNLLCLIAAQSRVPLAQTLASKVCHQLHMDLFPLLGDLSIRDAQHIQIDVGSVTQQFYQSQITLGSQQKEGQNQEQMQQQGLEQQTGNRATPRSVPDLTSSTQDYSIQNEAIFAQADIGEQQLSSLFASYTLPFVDSSSSGTQGISSLNLNTNDLADACEALFTLPFLHLLNS